MDGLGILSIILVAEIRRTSIYQPHRAPWDEWPGLLLYTVNGEARDLSHTVGALKALQYVVSTEWKAGLTPRR